MDYNQKNEQYAIKLAGDLLKCCENMTAGFLKSTPFPYYTQDMLTNRVLHDSGQLQTLLNNSAHGSQYINYAPTFVIQDSKKSWSKNVPKNSREVGCIIYKGKDENGNKHYEMISPVNKLNRQIVNESPVTQSPVPNIGINRQQPALDINDPRGIEKYITAIVANYLNAAFTKTPYYAPQWGRQETAMLADAVRADPSIAMRVSEQAFSQASSVKMENTVNQELNNNVKEAVKQGLAPFNTQKEEAVKEKTATKKAAKDKAVTGQTAADQVINEQAANEKKTTTKKAAKDKAVTGQTAADQAVNEQAANEKKTTTKKSTKDKAVTGQAVNEQAVKEKTVGKKAATTKKSVPQDGYVPYQTNNESPKDMDKFLVEKYGNMINASMTGTPYSGSISPSERREISARLPGIIDADPTYMARILNKAQQEVMGCNYMPFDKKGFINKAQDHSSNEFKMLNQTITGHVTDLHANKKESFNREFNELSRPLMKKIHHVPADKKEVIAKEVTKFVKENIQVVKPALVLVDTFLGSYIDKAKKIFRAGKTVAAAFVLAANLIAPNLNIQGTINNYMSKMPPVVKTAVAVGQEISRAVSQDNHKSGGHLQQKPHINTVARR